MILRKIEGYDHYFISDTGSIFSTAKGTIRELKTDKNSRGYLRVMLMDKKRPYIHRLVATHFVEGRSETRNTVNHKDGCKTNNHHRNLEWCTPKENAQHAWDTGLRKMTEGYHGGLPPLRPIVGTDKVGKRVQFRSINEAARHVGGGAGNIYKTINKEDRSAYGYKWKYL